MSPTDPPPGQAPCRCCRAVRGLRSGRRSFFPVPSATQWLAFSFAHVSGDREPREVSRLLEGWPRRVYICFLPDAQAENNTDPGPHTVSELRDAEWLSWAMLAEALGGRGAASSGGLTRGVHGAPPYSCVGISSVAARFLRETEREREAGAGGDAEAGGSRRALELRLSCCKPHSCFFLLEIRAKCSHTHGEGRGRALRGVRICEQVKPP